MNNNPICQCDQPAEWLDKYCQECWERICAESFWKVIETLEVVS